jgi:hypothetical protein
MPLNILMPETCSPCTLPYTVSVSTKSLLAIAPPLAASAASLCDAFENPALDRPETVAARLNVEDLMKSRREVAAFFVGLNRPWNFPVKK